MSYYHGVNFRLVPTSIGKGEILQKATLKLAIAYIVERDAIANYLRLHARIVKQIIMCHVFVHTCAHMNMTRIIDKY